MSKLRQIYNRYKPYAQNDLIMYLGLVLFLVFLFVFFG